MAAKAKANPNANTNCWLIKSEPTVYSWDQLVKDGKTRWDGVRNFMARNHMRTMKKGDSLLFYHSNKGKEIVGIAKVARLAYPDPTAPKDEDWSAIDVEPSKPLVTPVTLAQIKATPALKNMQLVKASRLSVTAVTRAEYDTILSMGNTK